MRRECHLGLPVRTHEKNALEVGPAQEVGEHLYGRRVGPVEIVDCDDQRAHGRNVGDESGEFTLHPFR